MCKPFPDTGTIRADDYLAVHRLLERFYRILLIDTGNNMRAENWLAAAESADLLVVTSTVREDTGYSGLWMLDALQDAGYADVKHKTITVLSDPSPTVDDKLAADLVATMRVSPGCVGLAAPQVGVGAQVFCVDVSAHPKTRDHHGTFVLCNAEVVSSSRNEKAREGCMSVPDLTGDVKRASRLVVRGQLPGSGEEVELSANAFEARCLQHEIDHCQGLLFVDRVAGAHAIYARQTYL